LIEDLGILEILNPHYFLQIGIQNLADWMDIAAASELPRLARKYLNCLSEILGILWVLERIPANQHHIEGHPTLPHIRNSIR
jgi:hypothetical protein